jgi:hypothetical protein
MKMVSAGGLGKSEAKRSRLVRELAGAAGWLNCSGGDSRCEPPA